MLKAMMNAPLGDDVFGDDPTVNELEAKAADIFGMEAALFCTSGTMTNQIAIKVHTRPADEVICDRMAHVYAYEGGGIAFNSGASVKLLDGDRGRLNAEQVKSAINEDNVHFPRTSLVCLENTVNRGGGAIYNFEEIKAIRKVCDENHLGLHLDGARLCNALVETSQTPKEYGEVFDSISLCLSKGLGAPVGSVLLGNKNFIKQARRIRKVFGGGWRQAGILAAAGIYALDNNIQRLKEDHAKAKRLAQALEDLDYVESVMPQETNIVIFTLKENLDPTAFRNYLSQNGILAAGFGAKSIRFVTHLDVSEEMVSKVIDVLRMFKT
jgi:threonine aldolase